MVYPKFEDIQARLWFHHAKLGAWPLTVCLYHASIKHGAPLLDALDELAQSTPPAKLTLTFVSPTPGAHLSKLKLSLVEASEQLRVMHIACDSEAVTIEITVLGLEVLRGGVNTWLSGGEDFCVCARHARLQRHEYGPLDRACGELWFWGPTYSEP